jgi:hypothetical protein
VRENESDDPITLVSPEPPERSPKEEQSALDQERFYTPLPSTPSRKRKRVVSSSMSVESEKNEDEDDLGTSLPAISPDIDLIDFSKHRYDPYEQGQASPLPRTNSRRKRKDASARSSTYLSGDSGALNCFFLAHFVYN